MTGAVWIDLVQPDPVEERAVEDVLGVNIPTREEMQEIEISSRLYLEDGGAFMTAILPAGADGDDPEMAPVSFVLTPDRLVTIRYHEPRAFLSFPPRAERTAMDMPDATSVLVALLEALVDRLADILERAGRDIDTISRGIFRQHEDTPTDNRKVIEQLGRKGDLTSNIRDSLLTLERLAGFLGQIIVQRKIAKDIKERVKTLSRDIRSLLDHAGFLSQKITFLLDATLGLINIEQNAIIKIFSVAAVIFLPPTLIASIYGMNFEHMPELEWLVGYPFALGLMVVSAILPYAYFKHRRWL
nr:magnesium transporter CorA family protein [Paracoccus saliphilus]